jgi:hypothetical protein
MFSPILNVDFMLNLILVSLRTYQAQQGGQEMGLLSLQGRKGRKVAC